MSYAESFNHPDIQQMRQDLLLGKRNPICRVCWSDENLGMVSTRQLSIKDKPIEVLEKEVTNPKLKWLWADPGNYCNFACRTCFSEFSTNLGVEQAKRYSNDNLLIVRKPDLSIMADQDLSEIDTVMILGGEPFLNLEHLAIVDAVIQQKQTKDFTVIYVTNNSKPLPNRVVEYLRLYPAIRVIIVLSLDAVEQQFDYIRTNGKWTDFEQNFKYLCDLKAQGLRLSFNVNTTISVMNLCYLDSLYDWMFTNRIDTQANLTTSFVEGCDHYSFKVLGAKQKSHMTEVLNHSRYDFTNVIQALNQSVFDQQLLDKFWQEIQWTQKQHNLTIERHLPKLLDLLSM